MCTIIDFERYRNRKCKTQSYIEAMVKGLIEIYTCNRCGGEIEVINNNFPKNCPNCHVIIDSWDAE